MDVAAWLQDLGLERYVPAFREKEIEGPAKPDCRGFGGSRRHLGITAARPVRARRRGALIQHEKPNHPALISLS